MNLEKARTLGFWGLLKLGFTHTELLRYLRDGQPQFCPHCGKRLIEDRREWLYDIYSGEPVVMVVEIHCPGSFRSWTPYGEVRSVCVSYQWKEQI
jgi:hypothetical protein